MQNLMRIQHAFSAFIAVMILLILWGFFTTWRSTDRAIFQAQDSIHLQYRYALNIEKTKNELTDADFSTTDLNKAPVHYGKLNHWYQLTLSNPTDTPKKLVLLLDNPMADNLEVYRYQQNENAYEFVVEMGDRTELVPLEQRILPHTNLTLRGNETAVFRIHFQTQGAPYMPLAVFNENDFERYQDHLHLIWGTFIGIVLLMSAYNLVLYYGVGERAYSLYIGYIFAMLLLLGVVHGYGYYLFPVGLQQWLSDNIISINSLAAFFTLQFALHFLRYTKKDGNIYPATWAFSFVQLTYAFIAFLGPEYVAAPVFSVIQLITYGFIIRLIASRVITDFDWTKYYLISWIPFFFGSAIGYLLYSGALEYSFLNRHALMFSVIFEMAFISMALADRLGNTELSRLFEATHDFQLGLANQALLEEAIKRNATHTNRHGLSLIVVEISNYDAVIPYLRDEELVKVMRAISLDFSEKIEQKLSLLSIDTRKNRFQSCAMMRGEYFSFLVQSNNRILVQELLSELSNRDNFNPLQNEIPYRIHCLIGAAILTDYQANPLELILQAKRAISQAASIGAPYFIYNDQNNTDSDRKIRLAQDLGNAIQNNSLALYYQPQLLIKDQDQLSAEALLRWNHPQLGSISPMEFIAIAEETGLIKRLTRWVLNQAFSQTQALIVQGKANINTSINVSAYDLSRSGMTDEIMHLLQKYEVSAHHFTLELTETAHLNDSAVFKQNFLQLSSMGFKFAIDDFGTGYSSLTYANDHPFRELKIDKHFIQDMLSSKKQLTIVTATINMAKELGLHVTAEGVEESHTLRALKSLGCDKIQGYYVAHPMPFEEYANWAYSNIGDDMTVGENLTIPFNESE